jgi:hypothetical protein
MRGHAERAGALEHFKWQRRTGFIEQKETKEAKNTFYDYCFLGVLRFLLFNLMVCLF